jgi:hypothetical protein
MNWKGLGRKQLYPIRDIIPTFAYRDWRKQQKTCQMSRPRFETRTSQAQILSVTSRPPYSVLWLPSTYFPYNYSLFDNHLTIWCCYTVRATNRVVKENMKEQHETGTAELRRLFLGLTLLRAIEVLAAWRMVWSNRRVLRSCSLCDWTTEASNI